MNQFLAIIFAAFAVLGGGHAIADNNHAKQHTGMPNMPGMSGMSETIEGEVRKVDKDAKKITIKHGPIKSFDMPGMTMVFQVKDPAMLEKVKAGDKVNFEAEKLGGAFTVIKIEAAK